MASDKTYTLDYKSLVYTKLKDETVNFLTGLAVMALLLIGFLGYLQNPSLFTLHQFQNRLNSKKMAKAKPATYTIQEGDWIVKIAEDKYGNPDAAQAIMDANNIKDPNEINVGQVLILPKAIPTLTPSPMAISPSAMPENGQITDNAAQTKQVTFKGNKYQIQEGEGLWEIAEKVYGDGMGWTRIAEANKLKENDKLEVGQYLQIPR
jgi:nucleoid-associated protein YgaU